MSPRSSDTRPRVALYARVSTARDQDPQSVMAYVEVKASIDTDELRTCAQQAYEIRHHQTRWFWSNQGPNASAPIGLLNCIATRSYVFAFEGPAKPETVQRTLEGRRPR